MIGANIGEAILPANWFNATFGGGQAATAASPTATSVTMASEAATATSVGAAQMTVAGNVVAASGTFMGISISYLAPGMAI